MNANRFEPVLAQIRGYIAQGRVVGAMLYIEQGGEVLVNEPLGWSDRERGIAMTAETIFRMRSMTKPLVGATALMLVAEGRLATTDYVADHLPAFATPEKKDITVYHLLTHTSGLTGEIYDTLAGTGFTSLRQAVDEIGRTGRMAFRPGTAYEYSDTGSSTLGAVVAQVAGRPVEEVIAERILKPLRMADSFCFLPPQADSRRARVAATYRDEGGALVKYWDRAQPQLVPFFRASGGLYSTACDYARFARCFLREGELEGTRLLPAALVREALTGRTWELMTASQRADAGYSYGFHWSMYTDEYVPGAAGTFGHGGSDGTVVVVDPRRDLIVLYLTQSRKSTTRPEVVGAALRAAAQ